MKDTITIKINPKILYQLLISEVRYGLTRNNHLMPEGAFKNVKEILPEFFKQDAETAIATTKQLVEETITDANMQFRNNKNDAFDNRTRYLDFVKWGFEFIKEKTGEDFRPYNIGDFNNLIESDE